MTGKHTSSDHVNKDNFVCLRLSIHNNPIQLLLTQHVLSQINKLGKEDNMSDRENTVKQIIDLQSKSLKSVDDRCRKLITLYKQLLVRHVSRLENEESISGRHEELMSASTAEQIVRSTMFSCFFFLSAFVINRHFTMDISISYVHILMNLLCV